MSIQLENRDRSWLAAAGLALFVVLLLAYWVPAGPRKAYLNSLTALSGAQDELDTTQLLKLEEELRIESQQSIRDQLKARPATFNFFAEVDRTLTDAKLKERAELNKSRASKEDSPQEMIELRLSGVSMEELVDFLHRVYEKNSIIAVYQMNYLRPASDGRGLECDMTLVTIKPGV
jgi:hypothetical protein